MSFIAPGTAHFVKKWDPLTAPLTAGAYSLFGKGLNKPLGLPAVPDQNAASTTSQAQSDAMRQRRGLLANIYAGGLNQQAVSGKTTLGGI